MIEAERLPPHDIDAEEAVIGSLLIDGEAITKVASLLRPEDFFREKNSWAYDACISLYARNEEINQITVAHELSQQGRLEEIGGPSYLSFLISRVPTSVFIESYAQVVYRTALLRRLIDVAGRIGRLAYEAVHDVDSVLSQAEEMIYGLRHGRSTADLVHIRAILDSFLEESGLVATEQGAPIPHIKTGFIDIDRLLGGLQRSDMIVLAARPSLGKTSLALNIALNAAHQQGACVAIFSLEMSKEQVVQRLLANEAGVDSQRIRLDQLNDAQQELIMDATGHLAELPIYIDDTPGSRVIEMRSKVRRLHAERGVDLVIVDYLQLIHAGGSVDNRVQQIGEISRSLKTLARELNVPVLAVSQLSRAVEHRPDRHPMLSDLRESGSIEQDADVVMFIYRDDVYYTPEQWRDGHPNEPYPRTTEGVIAEIMVAKHRHGPTGQAQLLFSEKSNRFRDVTTRAYR
ncbi:MAG: replicative DNA helicase [Chloroflexi bacterium]|nr:replicative DNA helicase [Chloroflexota bacterium]